MRKLWGYLLDVARTDFHPWAYLWTLLVIVASVWFNYAVDFEDTYIDAYRGSVIRWLWYFLLYAGIYLLVLLPVQWIRGEGHRLRSGRFWLRLFLTMVILGVSAGFHLHQTWAEETYGAANYWEGNFARRLGAQFYYVILYVPFFLILWWAMDRKWDRSCYGLTTRNFSIWPYALMLLMMALPIAWASTQADFLMQYPRLQVWVYQPVFGLSRGEMVIAFELAYALSFIMVEWLFRGALIIGNSKELGERTILPMVAVYAALHFGKPLGETIGSVFGGYILGALALRSGSILGGCAVHIGVAWLMELGAWIQHGRLGSFEAISFWD